MKVIGAGYGRTGTKSLQAALEKLGFGKCYHMEELFRNPDQVTYWQNAMDGKTVDWKTLFRNYESIVDFPGSIYYKELAALYPKAKIILSVRDPEKWYQSVRETIYGFNPPLLFKLNLLSKAIYKPKARNLMKVFKHNDQAIWAKYFEGKFEDKDYAINKFVNHIEEVKSAIPSKRLLIHESKDGWQPLCQFLDVPIPEASYPRINTKEKFSQWAMGVVKEVLAS